MLWIGSRLSRLERLSVSSFLAHDHDVHVYAYERPAGMPAGAEWRDAASILPATAVFTYTGNGSYAGFANFFRYKLLLERGGWYADMDVVCLRRFDFDSRYVFSSEHGDTGQRVNAAIMKAPSGSAAMRAAWAYCNRSNPAKLRWGDTGSRLLTRELRRHELAEHVQGWRTFCPISYEHWDVVLDDSRAPLSGGTGHAVHLWNEMWRRAEQDKDADYQPECLYEELQTRYLGSSRTLEPLHTLVS